MSSTTTLSERTEVDADQVFGEGFPRLAAALAAPGAPGLQELLLPHCWWRDLVALGWQMASYNGSEVVAAFVGGSDRLPLPGLRTLPVGPLVVLMGGQTWVEGFFEGDTSAGRFLGHVRLRQDTDGAWRAWKAGYERVTLLERADGPGGTWWHNRYAGAEVDTPSILYSYSWMPWKWSRTHGQQAELQAYLAAVIERFGLADRIRYDTEVARVEWHDGRQEFSIHSADGEIMRAKHVVSAVGLLSDPTMPDIPGMADFQGPLFHSAKWDAGLDVAGKRIGVVGSGSTGIQLVPALAQDTKQVVQFQREPGWIVPKMARPYTDVERAALDSRLAQRAILVRQIIQRDRGQIGGGVFRPGTKQNTGAEAAARSFINRTLEGRRDLIEAVTPKYVYGGKRPIISDDFHPSLLLDNVKLVMSAVKQFTENGVIDEQGDEHELDAVIMATGFKANFLTTFDVLGRGGKTIHEFWDGDERAFLEIMVPEFPNFLIM